MNTRSLIQTYGAGALADDLTHMLGQEFKRRRVDKWQEMGHVPYRWRDAVKALARSRGHQIPDEWKQPLALTG